MNFATNPDYTAKWFIDEYKKGDREMSKSVKEKLYSLVSSGMAITKKTKEKAYPLQMGEGEIVTNVQRLSKLILEMIDSLEIKDNLEDADVQMHNHAVEMVRERATKIVEQFIPQKEDSIGITDAMINGLLKKIGQLERDKMDNVYSRQMTELVDLQMQASSVPPSPTPPATVTWLGGVDYAVE